MPYIDRTDLELYMEAEEIDQIIDSNALIIPAVIRDSMEFCREMLIQRYAIDAEYLLTGSARNAQLVKQAVAVALYYLSERLNTNFQSEARLVSFKFACKWLEDVASGNRNLNIPEIDTDNKQGYPVIWGSNPKTSNYL